MHDRIDQEGSLFYTLIHTASYKRKNKSRTEINRFKKRCTINPKPVSAINESKIPEGCKIALTHLENSLMKIAFLSVSFSYLCNSVSSCLSRRLYELGLLFSVHIVLMESWMVCQSLTSVNQLVALTTKIGN
jgi:hypothetical protein